MSGLGVNTFNKTITLRTVICFILFLFCSIIQPLCLGGLVSYFAPGQTHLSQNDMYVSTTMAYVYAGGIVFSSGISMLTFHPYILYMFEMGAKVRLGCSGLVYRKVNLTSLFANDSNSNDLFLKDIESLQVSSLRWIKCKSDQSNC